MQMWQTETSFASQGPVDRISVNSTTTTNCISITIYGITYLKERKYNSIQNENKSDLTKEISGLRDIDPFSNPALTTKGAYKLSWNLIQD